MNNQLSTPHPSDLYANAYDTSDACDYIEPAPFRAGPGCPVGDFNPDWCHKTGGLRLRGPDGLDYPARAFGAAGPFSLADAEGALCGVWNKDYNDGAIDGRNYGECNAGATCAGCDTFEPCAAITARIKEPAALLCKTALKMCVDPSFEGTSLEGNLGDCLLEPSEDPEDPLCVGLVERSTASLVRQDDGTFAPSGALSPTVCAYVGSNFKTNKVAHVPTEEPTEETP